jgi:hypothetical protein
VPSARQQAAPQLTRPPRNIAGRSEHRDPIADVRRHEQIFGVIRVIEDHQSPPGRITPDIRVIIADFSVRYVVMITRISLDLSHVRTRAVGAAVTVLGRVWVYVFGQSASGGTRRTSPRRLPPEPGVVLRRGSLSAFAQRPFSFRAGRRRMQPHAGSQPHPARQVNRCQRS